MPIHGCPTCGKVFDSRRGLGVHHSQVHDEHLPNRECAACGESFYSEYEKKYCSDECLDRSVSYTGSDNPNYSDAKEETACEICDTVFEYYPSEKPGKFCSECVESESWRTPFDIDGEKNPRWNGGKATVACDECDATVERYPHQITGEATFCGPDCQYAWLSEQFTGEGHPNWEGGTVGPYGKGWNAVRAAALERDGHECVVCGTTAEELGRNPDVHHVVPVRAFVEMPVLAERDAHTLDNVVSLCPPCHRRAEFGHVSRAELRWRAGLAGPANGRHACGSKTVASPSSSAL
ncbi:HNH endonuclease [Halomicrobium mukohataei]|uniref:HNH endonuclease n=1 Tax=Halomicrobium mukohataei TaxID=57705 RepID=A0A847UE30_9EURY|nr:HNH endonuclease [Halomicrobium mukohataei]NLV09338.1 HNH endonuclease [Halomicrobium mukohataei]